MIIYVKVKPNSNIDRITKTEEGYKIEVKAKPEDNKANLAVIKLLARHFNVSQKSIKIKNPTSRNKIIEINN